MDFSEALRVLKEGGRVTRAVWHEPGVPIVRGAYVSLDTLPPPYAPQLMVHRPGLPGELTYPLAGAQYDLLAGDWELAE